MIYKSNRHRVLLCFIRSSFWFIRSSFASSVHHFGSSVHHLLHPFIILLHPFIRSSFLSPQCFIRSSVHQLSVSSVHPFIIFVTSVLHPFIRSSTQCFIRSSVHHFCFIRSSFQFIIFRLREPVHVVTFGAGNVSRHGQGQVPEENGLVCHL